MAEINQNEMIARDRSGNKLVEVTKQKVAVIDQYGDVIRSMRKLGNRLTLFNECSKALTTVEVSEPYYFFEEGFVDSKICNGAYIVTLSYRNKERKMEFRKGLMIDAQGNMICDNIVIGGNSTKENEWFYALQHGHNAGWTVLDKKDNKVASYENRGFFFNEDGFGGTEVLGDSLIDNIQDKEIIWESRTKLNAQQVALDYRRNNEYIIYKHKAACLEKTETIEKECEDWSCGL